MKDTKKMSENPKGGKNLNCVKVEATNAIEINRLALK